MKLKRVNGNLINVDNDEYRLAKERYSSKKKEERKVELLDACINKINMLEEKIQELEKKLDKLQDTV